MTPQPPDYRGHLRRHLIDSDIPVSLHSGLIEYFAARRPTGSFLRAVLENDLAQAALRADGVNRWHLTDLALFVHHQGPAKAWGSAERVDAWLADPAPVPEVVE